MTPEQARMARAALRLRVCDVAMLAGVSPTTITGLESENRGTQSGIVGIIQKVYEDGNERGRVEFTKNILSNGIGIMLYAPIAAERQSLNIIQWRRKYRST